MIKDVSLLRTGLTVVVAAGPTVTVTVIGSGPGARHAFAIASVNAG